MLPAWFQLHFRVTGFGTGIILISVLNDGKFDGMDTCTIVKAEEWLVFYHKTKTPSNKNKHQNAKDKWK